MKGRLADKVAIVTGAGGGIGAATVLRFAEEGARVIAAEIDETSGRAAAAAAGANYLALDAADPESWRALVKQVIDEFGGIDILVNNAARRVPLTIEETTLELWRANQAVTSEGIFLGTKFVAEAMTGGGSIVNISSLAAFVGVPESISYSAAKGAVRAFSRSAALHFARRDPPIRVNVVAPGSTLTGGVQKQYDRFAQQQDIPVADIIARYTAPVPLRRMAAPREIAEAILFMASDEASFITGAELLVDGGATAA